MSQAAPRMKMSEDEIPFHIQEEIMKRLPVKSLVQFRSVSKAWKSLIDSSQFIAAHSLHRHSQPQHLFVLYGDSDAETQYVCYIDDDTFPQQRSIPTLPLSVRKHKISSVVGSSCGLLCLFGSNPEMFVLWNPSIRKTFDVVAASKPSFAGFGVCPVTSDPKIVSVTQSWDNRNNKISKVMVYTLSSGKWRSLSTNLPTELTQGLCSKVVIDRFIYWRAESQTNKMIMSFDLTNERFEAIDLPDKLADRDRFLDISKLRESLAIIQSEYERNTYTVWRMECGAQRLFTKLFTIKTPCDFIMGFRKNGVPIMLLDDGYNDDNVYELPKLVVYEPNSEHNNVIETFEFDSINVNSYVETLLLLDRSDCDVGADHLMPKKTTLGV